MKLDWDHWLYGLIGAIIGGGSTSVVASIAAMGLTPGQYNLSDHLDKTLKMFFTCFVINGVISMFMWLRQKPLPDVETEVTIAHTEIKEPDKTTKIDEKTTTTSPPKS